MFQNDNIWQYLEKFCISQILPRVERSTIWPTKGAGAGRDARGGRVAGARAAGAGHQDGEALDDGHHRAQPAPEPAADVRGRLFVHVRVFFCLV